MSAFYPSYAFGGDHLGVRETARFCGVEPRVMMGLPHDVMLATGWEPAADAVIEWYRTL